MGHDINTCTCGECRHGRAILQTGGDLMHEVKLTLTRHEAMTVKLALMTFIKDKQVLRTGITTRSAKQALKKIKEAE